MYSERGQNAKNRSNSEDGEKALLLDAIARGNTIKPFVLNYFTQSLSLLVFSVSA